MSQASDKDLLDDLFEEKLIDVSLAAKSLGCSVATVYRLMHSGEIRYIKLGPRKGYKIPVSALREFVKRRTSSL